MTRAARRELAEKRNAELAGIRSQLTHQDMALEALSCAVNGMNKVAWSWYSRGT
jgi:hypothetical protein